MEAGTRFYYLNCPSSSHSFCCELKLRENQYLQHQVRMRPPPWRADISTALPGSLLEYIRAL